MSQWLICCVLSNLEDTSSLSLSLFEISVNVAFSTPTRVCTIRTYDEVLVLVLGVEPEPNLMIVLKQLGSVILVWVGHRDANRTLGRIYLTLTHTDILYFR